MLNLDVKLTFRKEALAMLYKNNLSFGLSQRATSKL
jgi:hypothetical protein